MKIIILSQQSTSHPLVFALEMSLHDGTVHISTGLYWGLLVSYIGGYSTFFSGLAWFLIVGYHTHETFHLIVNSVCKRFYQRVISSSIDNIIEELASYGFNNPISVVGSFGLSCLKHCLPPNHATTGGASTGSEIGDAQILCGNVHPSMVQTRGLFTANPQRVEVSNVSILDKFGHRSQLSVEARKARLWQEQNPIRSETLQQLEHRLRFQESMAISSPKKAPTIKMPSTSEDLN